MAGDEAQPEKPRIRKPLECTCPPKEIRRDAYGRSFREWDLVRVLNRTVSGRQPNGTWLYSVDELEDVTTSKVHLQVVRWQARFDDEHHPIWLNRARYNVRSVEQWDSAAKVIDSYLGRATLRQDESFQLDFAPVEPGARRHRGADDLDERQADEVNNLRSQLKEEKSARAAEAAAKRKAHAWMRDRKRYIRSYQRVLDEFKTLIKNSDTTETEVHKFILDKNPTWLFGSDYLEVEGPLRFPPKPHKDYFIFDLMLHRMDNFFDLVELKGPAETLFDRRSRKTGRLRGKLNSKLSEAIGQVMAYMNACDRFGRGGLFKPKAMIVIGNQRTDDPRQRRILQSHLAHVEVLTYSDLVDRGTQFLRHLAELKD